MKEIFENIKKYIKENHDIFMSFFFIGWLIGLWMGTYLGSR